MDVSGRQGATASAKMYAYLTQHPGGCTVAELASGTGASYANAAQYLYRLTRADQAVKREASWSLKVI